MKTLNLFLFLSLIVVLVNCKSDTPSPEGDYQETVKAYSIKIGDINRDLEDFIDKSQRYESANFMASKPTEVSKIINDYIKSGEKLVNTFNEINQIKTSSFHKSNEINEFRSSGAPCSAYDFIPAVMTGNVSPGLAKTVGDLIGDTKKDVALVQKQYDKGEIDDYDYLTLMNGIRNNQLGKARNYSFGAIVGTGAAAFTGLAVGVATLPAIATVTAVGVTVGTTVTWFANWYTGTKSSDGMPDYYMTTGKTKVGDRLPLQIIPEGSNVSIHVKGQAPVYMTNFKHPEAGTHRSIEINSVKEGEVEKGTKAQVCIMDEPLVATTCSDIEFVNAYATPSNPSPGQSVIVTATVIPVISGCNISFSIVGTDGYSDSKIVATDSNGQATFRIPGASSGVFDKVTIKTSNGKSYIVTYTF